MNRTDKIALRVLIAAAGLALLWGLLHRKPDVDVPAIKQAVENVSSAKVALVQADSALAQHAREQAAATPRTATHQEVKRLTETLKRVEADTTTAPAVIIDTAHALIDSLRSEVEGLAADTLRLGQDNARLAAALLVARERLVRDTVFVLPMKPHRSFLKSLLPSFTLQKDLVSYDLADHTVRVEPTRVSLGVGWRITF